MQISQRQTVAPPAKPTGSEFLAVSLEDEGNLRQGLGAPATFRRQGVTQRAHKNRCYILDLDDFNTFADGFFDGMQASVYVFENGKRKLIRQGTIATSKVDLTVLLQSSRTAPIAGTSFEYGFFNFNRHDVPYAFKVAPVDAEGLIGEASDWVTYTLPGPRNSAGQADSVPRVTVENAPSTGGTLPAPQNLVTSAKPTDDKVAVLNWDPVVGAAGYIVYLCYQDPTLNAPDGDAYIEFATPGRPIPAGAHVIIEGQLLTAPTKIAYRSWHAAGYYRADVQRWAPEYVAAGVNSRWVAYDENDASPFGQNAQHFKRVTVQSNDIFFDKDFHGAPSQVFRDVLVPNHPYRFRVMIRASAATDIEMSLSDTTIGQTYPVTTEWQWFETDIMLPDFYDNSRVSRVTLRPVVPATGVDVDIAAYEFFDPTLAKDDLDFERKAQLSTGTFLRDHRHVKPDDVTSGIAALTNNTGHGARYKSTLFTILQCCQINALKPWLQIEWFHSKEDWLDIVAYLAAPVSSGHPMALKRASQGQESPWTDVFPEMMFEFGNEAWLGGNVAFWQTPRDVLDQASGEILDKAEIYGITCDDIMVQMQSSPFWAALRKTTHFFIGGHINSSFGGDAAALCLDADFTGPSVYNGGWEAQTPAPRELGADFLGVLSHGFTGRAAWTARRDEALAANCDIFSYEEGPGYSVSFLTSEQSIAQEVVMKSRAAAVAHLDGAAYRCALGFKGLCYFTLGPGSHWKTHAGAHDGSGTFAAYGLLKAIWDVTGEATVTECPTVQNPQRPSDGIPAIAAYMFRSVADPSTCVMVTVNRNIDHSMLEGDDPDYSAVASGLEPVTLQTGIGSVTGSEFISFAGNFRDHNRYSVGQRKASETGYDADPLSVAFDLEWQNQTAPIVPSALVVNELLGGVTGGVPAGSAILIKLTGCSFL